MAATRTAQSLQEAADACARLAVAAGATPGVAASMVLPHRTPSFTKAVKRKQYEEVQRQAKRSSKSLIASYNKAIEQINIQLAYSWPTISPATAASFMPEAQRQRCADTALHCAQMLSQCASLLPDEVGRIKDKRQTLLAQIATANAQLRRALDSLVEAQSALRSMISGRYFENAAAMSPAVMQRLHAKLLGQLEKGDNAIEHLLEAVSLHVRCNEALTRNAIHAALLIGVPTDLIKDEAKDLMPTGYLRRFTPLTIGKSAPNVAIAEVRQCAASTASSKRWLQQIKEQAAGWRVSSQCMRSLANQRLSKPQPQH